MSPGLQQQGHALLTSMILAILMGVLAIGGYRSALLESKIADSYWRHQSAFERAEGAMVWAKSTLINTHLLSETNVNPPYPSRIYPVPDPDPYPGHDPHGTQPATVVSLQVLRNDGSLAVGNGENIPRLNNVWTAVEVTTLNRDGRPTVQLRGVFERGAVTP